MRECGTPRRDSAGGRGFPVLARMCGRAFNRPKERPPLGGQASVGWSCLDPAEVPTVRRPARKWRPRSPSAAIHSVTFQAQWRRFSESLHVGWQTRPRSRTLSPFSRLLSLSGARHSVTAGTHGSTLTGYYIETSCRGADDVCQRLATSSWKLLAP